MIKRICVGKIKEKFYSEAVLEFQKRLSKYTKLEIIELNDITTNQIEENKKREAINIQKYINERDYIITLEIEGHQLSSEELAQKIDSIYQTNSTITFIIGGSYGLDDSIKKQSNPQNNAPPQKPKS